jgi:glycosyltransferase involved in cell wall biosynthesis
MGKILVVVPPVAGAVGGGLWIQAKNTAAAVETHKISLERYNPWESYNWDTVSAVHIFHASKDTLDIALFAASMNIPLIVSPVFFSVHSPPLIRAELFFSSCLQMLSSGIQSNFSYAKKIFEIADILLPNTDEEADKIARVFNISPRKITIIPNGIEPRFSTGTDALFSQIYGETGIILSVTNIGYKRKNTLNLIRALKKIPHPAYIFGPIPQNAYGQACVREARDAAHIHLPGPLKNTDPLLASAYAAARVFVLPSLYETPGIASLEAASAHTTVVTTSRGGTRYYFQDFAYYVNPHSIDDIRQKTERALREPKKDISSHILENFTWDKIGEQTAHIYRSYL